MGVLVQQRVYMYVHLMCKILRGDGVGVLLFGRLAKYMGGRVYFDNDAQGGLTGCVLCDQLVFGWLVVEASMIAVDTTELNSNPQIPNSWDHLEFPRSFQVIMHEY